MGEIKMPDNIKDVLTVFKIGVPFNCMTLFEIMEVIEDAPLDAASRLLFPIVQEVVEEGTTLLLESEPKEFCEDVLAQCGEVDFEHIESGIRFLTEQIAENVKCFVGRHPAKMISLWLENQDEVWVLYAVEKPIRPPITYSKKDRHACIRV